MAASLYKARLNDAKSNLINSVTPELKDQLEDEDDFSITPLMDQDMES